MKFAKFLRLPILENIGERLLLIIFFFYIVESKERNAERLASDMTIIREQITFFDALQTDIITLLDNKIITKMNQFRRELEVTYFRYFAQ